MTLAKLLNFYKLQPPHLLLGDNIIIYTAWFFFLERLSGCCYSASAGSRGTGGAGRGGGCGGDGDVGHGDGTDDSGSGDGGIPHGGDDDGNCENVDDSTGIYTVHLDSEHLVIKSQFRTFGLFFAEWTKTVPKSTEKIFFYFKPQKSWQWPEGESLKF